MGIEEPLEFGVEDASFRAAGGEAGLRRLVDDFYDIMDSEPQAQTIRQMHPRDLAIARDKLARFLCGWLGGPKRYAEKYGSINIPSAHTHFVIGVAERDAWLSCMESAIGMQPFSREFAAYLLKELRVPANGVYKRSRKPPGETLPDESDDSGDGGGGG